MPVWMVWMQLQLIINILYTSIQCILRTAHCISLNSECDFKILGCRKPKEATNRIQQTYDLYYLHLVWVHKLTRIYMNMKTKVWFTMWPVVFQRKLLLDKRIIETEEMCILPVVVVLSLNNDENDFFAIIKYAIIIIIIIIVNGKSLLLHFASRIQNIRIQEFIWMESVNRMLDHFQTPYQIPSTKSGVNCVEWLFNHLCLQKW